MDSDRIDKSEYKQAVQNEKKKLMRQVYALTVFSAAIAMAFYFTLSSTNNKQWYHDETT